MTDGDRNTAPAKPEAWAVETAAGANPRRVRAGQNVIAYATTVADAHRIAHAGTVTVMLLATLDIAREILSRHAPDFQGRDGIIRLIDSAVRFGRGR